VVSPVPIYLTIYSPVVPNLTLVDMPGGHTGWGGGAGGVSRTHLRRRAPPPSLAVARACHAARAALGCSRPAVLRISKQQAAAWLQGRELWWRRCEQRSDQCQLS
jgi:hypothetical protein